MCGRLKSGFWVGLRGNWGGCGALMSLWGCSTSTLSLLSCFVPSQGWFDQVALSFEMMAMLGLSV